MEERKEERTPSYSKIIFTEAMVPGYIRDLSPGGFRCDLLQSAGWSTGEELSVRVVPHEEIPAPQFILSVEIRWIKQTSAGSSLGLKVSRNNTPEAQDLYRSLVEFYAPR